MPRRNSPSGSLSSALVVLVAAATAVEAGWQTQIAGSRNAATSVAVDAAGDALAAGHLEVNGDGQSDFAVIKLDGVDGAELWRFTILSKAALSNAAYVSMVDAAGDILAGGELHRYSDQAPLPAKFVALKLAAATGAELWRYEIPAAVPLTISVAQAMAVHSGGDVIVGGVTQNHPLDRYVRDFTVVRLAAASGTEIWRRDLRGGYDAGGNAAIAVALDGAGDVLAAGFLENIWVGEDFAVIKLDGATGAEAWRFTMNGTSFDGDPDDHVDLDFDAAVDVVADAAGDVLAAGWLDNAGSRQDLYVVKLSGIDGSVLWSRQVSGTTVGGRDAGASLVLTADGRALVTGTTDNAGTGADLTIVELDGASGEVLSLTARDEAGDEEAVRAALDGAGRLAVVSNASSDIAVAQVSDGTQVWRHVIDGGGVVPDFGTGLALDAGGDAFVAGSFNGGTAFVVAKFDGDGTPNPTPTVAPTPPPGPLGPLPVEGGKLVLRDREAAPERRRLSLLARDYIGVQLPTAGTTADPTHPVDGGGELRVSNPASGQTVTIDLPIEHWTARGNPPGSTGYEYRDPTLASGPCKRVSLRAGKLKAVCGGAGLGFSLGDSPQGSLAVRLRTGGPSAPLDYCLSFAPPGVLKDTAATAGRTGVFRAASAVAPTTCP